MELSLIDKVHATFPLTVKDSDGNAVTPSAVGVAFLPFRGSPDTVTAWIPATYAAGAVTVLLAGPLADPTGAVVVPPGGGQLWVRITDSPEVEAVRVAWVSAPSTPLAPPTTSVVGLAVVA